MDDEDDIEEYIDKLFDAFMKRFRRPLIDFESEKPSWDVNEKCIEPLVNLYDEGDHFILTADLPKVKKDNIKINADENTVEIAAEMENTIKFDRWGTIQKEVEFCRYKKLLRLPEEIKPEEAKAEFKRGILTVKLPKKKKTYTLKIE